MRLRLGCSIAGLLVSTAASAADLHLVAQECKSVFGVLSNATLKVADTDKPLWTCTRQANNMVCDVTYQSGLPASGSPVETFLILRDAMPELVFGDPGGSSFFIVDTFSWTAVATTRIYGKGYAGQKVCTFIAIPKDEYEKYLNLRKSEQNRTKP